MHGLAAAALACVLALAGPAQAQSEAPQVPAGVAVIDQGRLITDTAMGRALEQRFQAASRALIAENREIEAALEAEERALTVRRANIEPAEFRRLASEFDAKVEGIRNAQEAKSRTLTRQRDEERQRIVEQALPILARLMQDREALVLIDRASVVISRDAADITDEAIARLDALTPPAPATEEAPEPAGTPEGGAAPSGPGALLPPVSVPPAVGTAPETPDDRPQSPAATP
ncbi:outer membrane protein [Rhodobacter sphaeroides]|uniref:Outer membrane protein n=1 Tax=Cereibacter sphaeroides (strain ATCC 17023 / DSM 158 / JCM 6121 / CCUG 31486 / LMG 2827 / NBRC 12203 / NCIMB 8253 / ATH 2.4.1.) TaxID=272943 RepID=Q3J2W7_CERS4|nr:OmpH family outer membrane protein [Cereibacter sphaeroides]ABA78867.1 outer membrane protein [Cereibacter sphaeroides 2.4.1]AMJ47197.1 outer membrane chaperone Skp [Cereibacter sphaeroides]ANS33909.1 outer membrane chaperone Skp [Cereibacter sphaeroides]ATN62953.1 outer membrane chaperone Skp [Cereibacter sphaeroides]AXC61076.1 outer membrane protein [Cereibacter sphaeroides 2.4.1]